MIRISLLCLLIISDTPIVILEILKDLYFIQKSTRIVDFLVKILTYIEELFGE
jgi:hypothetical protein